MNDLNRWFSPDPLSEEFPDWSPYNYAFNNPIRNIDPDGNAPEDVIDGGDEDCCNDFFTGIKEGISGRIQGIKSFINDPVGTTKNAVSDYTWSDYVDGTANSLTMGIYGTAKTGGKAIQGDYRGAGRDVGEKAFDMATVSATAGAVKGIKAIKPTTLYRGVNEGHAGYLEALQGKATPAEHNGGNTNSNYTSWTKNKEVAKNYSLRPNGNGVILKKTVPVYKTVKSPSLKNVNLKQTPGKIVNEQEILLRGKVRGAKITN
ncbi:RHS repeat-associated core domain-containing protein [Chryseobacterium joostei]|nr:RHS repeat-associated core domain-containing protein [Chryseobacterium joostei]